MPDRRAQIVLLLGSRFDYTHEPINFTAKVVRRGATTAKQGGSPSHWQDCQRCNASGSVSSYNRLVACETCHGAGRYRVDDYTGETVVTDEARDVSLGELIRRDTQHVRCPDCQDLHGVATGVIRGQQCRRCSGTGQAPVAGSWLHAPNGSDERTSGDALDALLDAIERRDKLGSYHALDLALAGVVRHVNKPLTFAALTVNATTALRLLDELYLPPTTRSDDSLSTFEWSLVELALAYIDTRMPDLIVVPRDVTLNAKQVRDQRDRVKGRGTSKQALERRDKEIRTLVYSNGRAVQWVAAEYGLSVSQVNRIAPPRRDRVA